MCYYSCLTRIRCVSAFSFKVPSTLLQSSRRLRESAKKEKKKHKKKHNPVGARLLSTYLAFFAAQPRLVPLMWLPARFCASPRFGGRWITSSPIRFVFFPHLLALLVLLLLLCSFFLSCHRAHSSHQNRQNANLHLFFLRVVRRRLPSLITQRGSMRTNINLICASRALILKFFSNAAFTCLIIALLTSLACCTFQKIALEMSPLWCNKSRGHTEQKAKTEPFCRRLKTEG